MLAVLLEVSPILFWGAFVMARTTFSGVSGMGAGIVRVARRSRLPDGVGNFFSNMGAPFRENQGEQCC